MKHTESNKVAKELYKAKRQYYSNKVIDNHYDPKALSKIATNLLVNQHQTNLPTSEEDSIFANNFSTFFSDKIKHLRSNFVFGIETDATILQFTGVKICSFKHAILQTK